MFWGLAGCPPETVERVLKNYNDIVAKGKAEEDKKRVAIEKKQETRKNYEKFMELVKKNPPRGFKDILEYSMILSYYTKELNDKTLRLM
tara:strand:+ start:255 stop:521 length:267 start_codon:yes stop_codon:yes gene_type:complete